MQWFEVLDLIESALAKLYPRCQATKESEITKKEKTIQKFKIQGCFGWVIPTESTVSKITDVQKDMPSIDKNYGTIG